MELLTLYRLQTRLLSNAVIMSRQTAQNGGTDAFSETFRLAKEAEDLRLAKERADKEAKERADNAAMVAEARAMHNGFTKGGRKGSGSVRGRGPRGRPGSSPIPIPRKVDIPSRVPQEFTDSDFTSRTGVNTEYPGRGGFSTALGGMISSTNRERENQGWVSQQDHRAGNHQVAGFQQRETERFMGHQTRQAANNQATGFHTGFQQQENQRFMGHQTGQAANNQATGVQQQESQHRMGHQTQQAATHQVTGAQQQGNQHLMDHQAAQSIDNQIAGFKQHGNQRPMGYQTQQPATHQVAAAQQKENQRLMDYQTPQPVNNQFTGVQQKENERLMDHQTILFVDKQVADHYTEAMSTGGDVEMTDGEADRGSRKTGMNTRPSTHGGIEQSRWADAEKKKKNAYTSATYDSPMSDRSFKGMTSTSTQRFAEGDDRWTPARIAE